MMHTSFVLRHIFRCATSVVSLCLLPQPSDLCVLHGIVTRWHQYFSLEKKSSCAKLLILGVILLPYSLSWLIHRVTHLENVNKHKDRKNSPTLPSALLDPEWPWSSEGWSWRRLHLLTQYVSELSVMCWARLPQWLSPDVKQRGRQSLQNGQTRGAVGRTVHGRAFNPQNHLLESCHSQENCESIAVCEGLCYFLLRVSKSFHIFHILSQ